MYAYEYPNYVMKEERGDLVVGRKFNFRNECRYAKEHGIEYNKILGAKAVSFRLSDFIT